MGRGDHTKFHHIHGCAQITVTSEGPTASDLAGAGHGLCEVQGEWRVRGEERDGRYARNRPRSLGGVLNLGPCSLG